MILNNYFVNLLLRNSSFRSLRLFRRVLSNKMSSKTESGVKMFLDPESDPFKQIFTPELKTLSHLFIKYGYELRIAGGAVRDLLINNIPHDVDFATPATPTQMKTLFDTESIRMINMRGEKHGTITARIGEQNFEVTTLRIDVVTDGRHAEVEFTTDWRKDAGRRDLTVNSMFLGLDGAVYDYNNGYEDLKNRKIAFVGEPSQRIQEDYLRILRYFRFFGRLSLDPHNHDQDTLKAISSNVSGLKNISGERIWTELNRILIGSYSCEIVKEMLHLGIGPFIGLPENCNIKEFERVCEVNNNDKLYPITYIASLLNSEEDVLQLNSRLKLSAFERDLALFIVEYRNKIEKNASDPLRPFQRYMLLSKNKPPEIKKKYVIELLKYFGNFELKNQMEKSNPPRIPINGEMLKKNGVPAGKLIGRVLDNLKEIWIDSNYTLTEPELLEKIPNILSKFINSKKKIK